MRAALRWKDRHAYVVNEIASSRWMELILQVDFIALSSVALPKNKTQNPTNPFSPKRSMLTGRINTIRLDPPTAVCNNIVCWGEGVASTQRSTDEGEMPSCTGRISSMHCLRACGFVVLLRWMFSLCHDLCCCFLAFDSCPGGEGADDLYTNRIQTEATSFLALRLHSLLQA